MALRTLPAAVLAAALTIPAAALAGADLARGTNALRAAYEQTEGDEGGYGGSLVEQCRVEGESAVRCVIVEGNGNGDLDTADYAETRAPIDFGVADFAPDDSITTRREPFAEAPRPLDADIRVAARMRRTRSGRLVVEVSPDVASRVTVAGWFGCSEIARRGGRSRTVEVPGGRTTTVALDLTRAQRDRIRKALRRRGRSIRGVVSVLVVGDVGPADATALRIADIRVVR